MEHQCVKLTHKLTKNHGNTPSRCRTEPHATQTENQLKDYRNLVNLAPMARFASIIHGKFKNSRFFVSAVVNAAWFVVVQSRQKGFVSERKHGHLQPGLTNPTMHQSYIRQCTILQQKCVYISITKWCIVGCISDTLWDFETGYFSRFSTTLQSSLGPKLNNSVSVSTITKITHWK